MMAYRESDVKPYTFLYTELEVSDQPCRVAPERELFVEGRLSLTRWTQWRKIQ
jgi:hypothetical protein